MASVLAIAYDTATGRWFAQKLGGAQLAVDAINTLTLIADGLFSGAPGIGKFVSGFWSGAGALARFGTGLFAADADGRAKFADGFLTSAKIGIGEIGGNRVAGAGILSGKYAGLSIQAADVNWGAVASGKLAALGIQATDINWGAIASGKYAAGSIRVADIGDNQLISGKIGSGQIGGLLLQDLGIVSGKVGWAALTSGVYAVGSVTEDVLASGISIDISEMVREPTYSALEPISAFACVYISLAINSSGRVGVAKAISGTMPAVGLVPVATASGSLPLIALVGRSLAPTSIVSGQQGKVTYVGTSGQLTLTPISTSGNICQQIGLVTDNAGVFLFPNPIMVEIAG